MAFSACSVERLSGWSRKFRAPRSAHLFSGKRHMRFEDLGLSEPLLRAVRAEGYEIATPIQVQAIPLIAAGRDVVGCAQTGTGKTAAFALPTLELLAKDRSRGTDRNRPIRALILCPTREL